jgi:hypothetical protein
MSGLVHKNFGKAEETRPFVDGKGHVDVVTMPDGVIGMAVFEPGWQWSKHVKPIAGTDSCQAAHFGYTISGRMHVVMDDGESADFGPGDVMEIAPGHDAWVLGDEPCVMVDWQGFTDYAKQHD